MKYTITDADALANVLWSEVPHDVLLAALRKMTSDGLLKIVPEITVEFEPKKSRKRGNTNDY